MSETTRGTMTEFIDELGITATAEQAPDNPQADDDTWGQTARHWLVTLRRQAARDQTRTLEVPFSQGEGWTTDPTAKDVLECLASDASSVISGETFEEWASEYGYDTDSRRAERTFKAVKDQTAKAQAWLGREGLERLVWETDHDS